MNSKSVEYGVAGIELIASNIPDGQFNYANGILDSVSSLVDQYFQYSLYGNPYKVHGTGKKKYSGNVRKFTVHYDLVNPSNTYTTFLSETFLGEFDYQFQLNNAMNAYCGYNWILGTSPYLSYADRQLYLQGHYPEEFEWGARGSFEYVNVWKVNSSTSGAAVNSTKPCYKDLITGYYLDPKSFPKLGKLMPAETKRLTLGYYAQNSGEGIDGLTTIDWYHYDIELTKGKAVYLPIGRPVLGTLWVDDPVIEGLIRDMPHLDTEHPVNAYFPAGVSDLFSYWNSLYEVENSKPVPVLAGSLISQIESQLISSTVKILGANNNVWNNGAVINDVGFDPGHPMFAVDEQLAFARHFKPQVDGSFGDLVMNSPKLDDLWTHFCSQTPALNELDNTLPRLNTHGHLIQETANRIGYQPDANGIIDSEVQKTLHETKSADIRKPLDKENYSPYGFGKKGMAIANLPNDYDGSNPKNGGGSLVTSIPNLMLELHSQINKAIDIQASSNIVFTANDKKVHYTNQAALLVDLARTVAMLSPLVNTIYANSLQTESQVREIIGALGLGTTDDSIGLNINGQSVNLPFKGVDRRESLVNELADIKLTLAVIAGKLI
jgi:hypothetical protein